MMTKEEMLVVFIEESTQHLETIEPDLLEMENNIGNMDSQIVNRVFRAVHSIKGASGFFGLKKIGELSHCMENLLAKIREGKIKPDSEFIDALLSGIDALRAMLDDVNSSENFDIQSELDNLTGLIGGSAPPQKKISVREKKQTGKHIEMFDIPENEIEQYVKAGQFLYTIHINLKKDLTDQGRTPLDLVNDIVSTGELIESRLDINAVQGLADCLENEISFIFAFATIMEEDLIPTAIGIPEAQVTIIDIKAYREKYKSEIVTEYESMQEKISQETCAVSNNIPEDMEKEQESTPRNQPSNDASVLGSTSKIKPAVQTEEKIRVGVNFLNDLVNLAGEMVLGRNQLNQIALPLVKDTPGLNPVIQHISRITTEMQEKIMQMRMQSVSMIFGKFQRVVRDLARNLNKEIKLTTFGEDVELDKSIIEALSDPLTHLIRNSVDHGIESPAQREGKGKPRQGTIQLKAYHQAGHVYIDIIDDGDGIDCNRVGEKAVEKGIITQEQKEDMNAKELARLIFKPGFSTASQVSSVSGRGVGMDVVLTNIEQLGGSVDITTRINEGTTISLILPLTLAIVSGLVIQTAEQFFILPEANIDELVRIKPEEIEKRINIIQESHVLRLRDMLLPLVSLSDILNLTKEGSNPFEKKAEPARVLIIKQGASLFGLLVDVVENIEEIVVKPLPRYLRNQQCFSGASIMGNGSVSLILDVAGLFKKAGLQNISLKDQKQTEKPHLQRELRELQTLLLFNNNTKEKFALPLEQITRVERVESSKIETIKDRHYLQYQGEKLRLIFLEDHLPVASPQRSEKATIGVIVPKHVKHPMGIVIHGVDGTINTEVTIDTKTITSPGLFGSAILDDKITLLPDMYRLFELAAPELYLSSTISNNETNTKKQILLVEDTPFFRMIEKDYLTSAGYDVVEAENGKQALDILNEQNVDAVISDIVMPEMDGWETIKAIRADKRFKNLPVMAVTSLGNNMNSDDGLKAGFTQWEAKLNKDRLLEKLGKMFHHKKEVA